MDERCRKAGFQHVFRREIVTDDDFIREVVLPLYPDWKKVHTYFEDGGSFLNEDGEWAPLREFGLMNRDQLVGYIKQFGIDIDPGLYQTAEELKTAITEYRDDRKAFLAYQDKRKDVMGDKLAVKKAVRDLNPWGDRSGHKAAAAQEFSKKDCIPEDLVKEDKIKKFLDEV